MQLDFDGLGGLQELYIPIDPVPASRPSSALRYVLQQASSAIHKRLATWFNYAKPCWFYLGATACRVFRVCLFETQNY